MVIDVAGVVNGVADNEKEFFRKLSLPERLTLQSFPASLANLLPESKILFAAGNAYPPVLIAATLLPMVRALSNSDLDLASHPLSHGLAPSPQVLQSLDRALVAAGKIVNQKKHAAYNATLKRANRKRARGSDSD